MKTRYINIVLLGATLCMASCAKFLEEDPRSITTTDTFYQSENDAVQALYGAYRNLTDPGITGHETKQVPTDLTKRANWDEAGGLSNFTFGADNPYFATMWQKHYASIKDCNAIIDNITLNRDKIANWERYVAQAKGIRAYLYFNLVRWFGDVPLILTTSKTLNKIEQVPRSPQKEVFQQIIEDLEYCQEYSMEKNDVVNGYQYGRFTKDAARGFLAKVHLWLASVAERDGKEVLGSASDNYTKSLAFAEAVIKGGRYELVEYYPDVFNAKTKEKATSEVLWGVQGLTGDGTGTLVGIVFGIRGSENLGGSWDNISSSDYHRMMYEPSDSIRRLWNCPRVQLQEDGTLWGWDYKKYWDTRNDQKLSEATENDNWVMWSIGKFRRFPVANLSTYNYANFGMDEPLLRYADVLLIYAEAYNEVHKSPGAYTPSSSLTMNASGVNSAYDAVNIVRKRARMANRGIMHEDLLPRELIRTHLDKVDECVPDWKPSSYGYNHDGTSNVWNYKNYSSDYVAFKNEILNERARELVAESTDRWCDLVRRGILVEQMQVWRLTNPFISQSERNVPAPAAPENVKKTHWLLPIPLREMDANKKLTQNPGY